MIVPRRPGSRELRHTAGDRSELIFDDFEAIDDLMIGRLAIANHRRFETSACELRALAIDPENHLVGVLWVHPSATR